jgi:hypothetical protein
MEAAIKANPLSNIKNVRKSVDAKKDEEEDV